MVLLMMMVSPSDENVLLSLDNYCLYRYYNKDDDDDDNEDNDTYDDNNNDDDDGDHVLVSHDSWRLHRYCC